MSRLIDGRLGQTALAFIAIAVTALATIDFGFVSGVAGLTKLASPGRSRQMEPPARTARGGR